MATAISEVDKIEILTLQDNYVDLVAGTTRPSSRGRCP